MIAAMALINVSNLIMFCTKLSIIIIPIGRDDVRCGGAVAIFYAFIRTIK